MQQPSQALEATERSDSGRVPFCPWNVSPTRSPANCMGVPTEPKAHERELLLRSFQGDQANRSGSRHSALRGQRTSGEGGKREARDSGPFSVVVTSCPKAAGQPSMALTVVVVWVQIWPRSQLVVFLGQHPCSDTRSTPESLHRSFLKRKKRQSFTECLYHDTKIYLI